MESGFALVDMVGQGVRLDSSAKRLGRDFGDAPAFGASAGVAGDAKDGRLSRDVGQKGCEEKLSIGRIAAWVGNALGRANGITRVELCFASRDPVAMKSRTWFAGFHDIALRLFSEEGEKGIYISHRATNC